MIHKYSVEAPTTPGARPTIQSTHKTLAEARKSAKRFQSRRDLKRSDVRIGNMLEGGKLVEYAGPPR